MKPGPFVTLFACLARIDERSTQVLARVLRDNDILPKGGRGRSALEVTPDYCAKLLIACLATSSPARSVEAYKRFEGMTLSGASDPQLVASALPDPEHTLLDLVTMFCDPGKTNEKSPRFTLDFVGGAYATLKIINDDGDVLHTLSYLPQAELDARAAQFAEAWKDEISGDGKALSELVAELEADGFFMSGIVETRSVSSDFFSDIRRLGLSANQLSAP